MGGVACEAESDETPQLLSGGNPQRIPVVLPSTGGLPA